MSLSLLFWATLFTGLISFWWQSDKIKLQALAFVAHHCKSKGLQLLDQTMVLKGVWLGRADSGGLSIRRRYAFEFSSTGETRYQGIIILMGRDLQSMNLDAHVLPD